MKRMTRGLCALAVMVTFCSCDISAEEQLVIIEIENDAARLKVSDVADFHVVRGIVNALRAGGISKSTLSIGIEEPVEATTDTFILVYSESRSTTTFICVSPNISFDRVEFFQDEPLEAGHEDVKIVSKATLAAMLTAPKDLTPQEGVYRYPSNVPSEPVSPPSVFK